MPQPAAPHALADVPATADWPVDDEALLLAMPWLLRGRGASELMHAVVAELAAGDPQRLRQALPVLRTQGLDLRLHRTPLLALPDAWLPAVLLLHSGDTCVLTARGHDADGQPRCTVVLQGPEGDDQFTTSTAELATEYSGQALVLHLLASGAPAAASALPRVVPLRRAAPLLVVADDAGPLPSLDELVGQRDLVDDPAAFGVPEPLALQPALTAVAPAAPLPAVLPLAVHPVVAVAAPWPAGGSAPAWGAADPVATVAGPAADAASDIRFSRPEPLSDVARRVAAQALPGLQALQRAASGLGSGLRDRAARVGQAARGAMAAQRARLATLTAPAPAAQADAPPAPGGGPLTALPPAPLPAVAEVLQRVTPLLLQDVVQLPPALLLRAAPAAVDTVAAVAAMLQAGQGAGPADRPGPALAGDLSPAPTPTPATATAAPRTRRPLRAQVQRVSQRTPQRALLPSSLRPQHQTGRAAHEIQRSGSSLAASVR